MALHKFTLTLWIILTLVLTSLPLQAFTITTFAPSAYNANTTVMNATLGIDSSYSIEDFEDLNFINGFTVTYDNVIGGNRLFNYGPWDGAYELGTYLNNYSSFPTFSFSQGLSSFGIGINNMAGTSYPAYMYINGILYGKVQDLPNFEASTRNIYIKINADSGEQINSVKFTTSSGDYVGFDHLAFKVTAVPEISTIYSLFVAGLLFLMAKKNGR